MAEEVRPEDLEITDELIAERNDFEPGETPEDMTSWQRPITAFIDILNNWVGRIIALLLVPLIAIVVWEVVLRNGYAILRDNGMLEIAETLGFGPTVWVYDTSRMLAGFMFMAAAASTCVRGTLSIPPRMMSAV